MTDITVSSFKITGKNFPKDEDFKRELLIDSMQVEEFLKDRTLSLRDEFKLAAGKSYVLKMEVDGGDNTLTLSLSHSKKKAIIIFKSPLKDVISDENMAYAVQTLEANYQAMKTGTPSQFEQSDIDRRTGHNGIATELQQNFKKSVPGLIQDFSEARSFADALRSIAHTRWIKDWPTP